MHLKKALEEANSGYYPYTVSSTEESAYLYLTLQMVEGLEQGMIICVGEVSSADQITSDTECHFGKIDNFYPLEDGRWMVVLSEPDLAEIFKELDVSYNQQINFDEIDIDTEHLEDELISALYRDDEFIKFLAVTNVSAKEYFDFLSSIFTILLISSNV